MATTLSFDWRRAIVETPQKAEKCPFCSGQDGKPKDVYRDRADAQSRAWHIGHMRGIRLREYFCPYGYGWHLTKA
jgi:hypothetical protein